MYSSTSQGVTVDLEAGTSFGSEVDSDTIANIENVVGGSGADTISGDAFDNKIEGGAGDDILDGRAGVDTAQYQGQSGDFTVTQNSDGTTSVTDTNTTDGLDEGNDTLTNFEFIEFLGDSVTIALGNTPTSNTSPVANDDSATTDEDSAITITAAQLLGNDTDADSDMLSITGIDTTGTLGTVSQNDDGSYSYNPNGAFEALNDGDLGSDSFTYTVSDGKGGTSSATVNIDINGVTDITPPDNNAPDAVDDPAPGNGGTGWYFHS